MVCKISVRNRVKTSKINNVIIIVLQLKILASLKMHVEKKIFPDYVNKLKFSVRKTQEASFSKMIVKIIEISPNLLKRLLVYFFSPLDTN